MKNLKRLLAVVLSASFMLTAVNMAGAAEFGARYNKTYTEDFSDLAELFGENGVFEEVQNVSGNVKITDSNQGGKYLEMNSNGKDVQIRTQKGKFIHDVTVIDMKVSSVLGTQAFPLIRLLNNSDKMDPGNGLFRFVSSNETIRSYNQTTGVYNLVEKTKDPSGKSTTDINGWFDVRIILDSVNKTITTAFNGSHAVTVSQMNTEWDNKNVQLLFQVATNATLRVDDLVISDGAYMENIYMAQDFEHSDDLNKEVGNGFFYNMFKTSNPTVVYDAASNNTYLDITSASSNIIHTFTNIDTTSNTVVAEFDIKATSAPDSLVRFRKANGTQTPLFKTGEIIADGSFHKYRAVVMPVSKGYKVVRFIDGARVETLEEPSGGYCGNDIRFDIVAGATSTGVGIDNIKVYYPQQAKLFCELNGKTEVKLDTAVEMLSNTPVNAESAKSAVITANNKPVNFTVTADEDKNSYIFNIEGGLKYATTYVISTGENGMKDMFEQCYNTTITFKTEGNNAIGGADSLFQHGVNSDNYVEYEDVPQVGQALKVTSPDTGDVQINTKKGLFKYDITTVEMSVRAIGNGDFPQIKVTNNNVKFGNQSLFIFVNKATSLRAYDVNGGSYKESSSGNGWKNLKIVFDSINKTITARINETEAVSVSSFDSAWDNENIQLNFQVAENSVLYIDDVVISDTSYMEDVYMNQDFEHSSDLNKNVGNNFFYNMYKEVNPKVVYDSANGNTYLDITSDGTKNNLIYTNSTIDILTNQTVVEFDMKATSAAGVSAGLKRSFNKAITPLFAENEIIADGEFHTYKAVVEPCARGYKVVRTVDNTALESNVMADGAYSGTDARLEIYAGIAATGVAIDNVKVYNVRNEVEGKISYTINGEEPTDNKLKAGDVITATFDVKANTKAGAVANGYVAIYDVNGSLIYTDLVELEAGDRSSDVDYITVDGVPADADSMKLLLWDNEFNPITQYSELTK